MYVLGQIRSPRIEERAKEKIAETLRNPEIVRAKVEEWRQVNKPSVPPTEIEESIEQIRRSMQNLIILAQNATDDETIANLTERMNELEGRKREAESLLYDFADDEEERAEIEQELQKFERWAEDVRPFLTDPSYLATASYEELRLAVRVLGLRVTVYPTIGDWPYRYLIAVTVPEVMKRLHCVEREPYIL